jgi:phosphoribosylaminoimidazole-succinocarboxamide synthase
VPDFEEATNPMSKSVVLETSIPNLPVRRGKVRDIYDLGDRILLVSTDRISAFDWVLPSGIPDKGRVLTQVATFWFNQLDVSHHLISTNVEEMDLPQGSDLDSLAGRTSLVRKTQVVPIECVVRGYLVGSGWKEYQQSGTVCGIQLPEGLVESAELAEPIFTPSTKAEEGHDENITFEQMVDVVGQETAEELRRQSLDIFNRGREYARGRGIIIADTKFEFGRDSDGRIILIDEVLTPDSSRFWPADQYEPGKSQPSFDKQFVRDWLTSTDWDKNSKPPALPDDVIARTREKYVEAYERLTGQEFGW